MSRLKQLPPFYTTAFDHLDICQLRNLYRELRTLATMGTTAQYVAELDDYVMARAKLHIETQGSPMTLQTQAVSLMADYAVSKLSVGTWGNVTEQTRDEGGFLAGEMFWDARDAKRHVLKVLNRYMLTSIHGCMP